MSVTGRKKRGGRPRPVTRLKARQAAATHGKGYKLPGSQNRHKSYPR